MKKTTLKKEVEGRLSDLEPLDPENLYPHDQMPIEDQVQETDIETLQLAELNVALKYITGRDALKEIEEYAKQKDSSEQGFVKLLRELYPDISCKDKETLSLLIKFFIKKSEENADSNDDDATVIGFCEPKPNLSYYDSLFSGCRKTVYEQDFWQ